MTVVSAPTTAEAQAKLDDYRSFASVEGNLARLSGTVLVDIGQLDLDQPLEYVETPGIQGIMRNFTIADFTELVVPELQRRGRVWPDYEGATLREYLGEPGQPRVADNHPAARYRAPKGFSQLPAEDPGQRSTR